MATAKMETAADKYRRRKQEQQKDAPVKTVVCSDRPAKDGFAGIVGCGAEWKARRASKEFWITSGMMPATLAAKMVAAVEKNGGRTDKVMRSMAAEEMLQSIVFSNNCVLYTAVEPKIVAADAGEGELLQSEVDLCCYNTLLAWQMTGGDEAERLENFPK